MSKNQTHFKVTNVYRFPDGEFSINSHKCNGERSRVTTEQNKEGRGKEVRKGTQLDMVESRKPISAKNTEGYLGYCKR